jgi:hypothetical protein
MVQGIDRRYWRYRTPEQVALQFVLGAAKKSEAEGIEYMDCLYEAFLASDSAHIQAYKERVATEEAVYIEGQATKLCAIRHGLRSTDGYDLSPTFESALPFASLYSQRRYHEALFNEAFSQAVSTRLVELYHKQLQAYEEARV